MVDNSGSTKDSDPQGIVRIKTVQNFINTYGSKTNFTYSFGYFAKDVSFYDVGQNNFVSSTTNYFGTAAQELQALDIFSRTPVRSDTHYVESFGAIKQEISDDFAKATNSPQYAVIFMSDGKPTDLSGARVGAQITNLVDQITAIAPGAITVSSVYFGPANNTDAIQNLQTAATAGKGVFLDSNTTTAFKIDDLITVPQKICN